jgi:hypothetical protein
VSLFFILASLTVAVLSALDVWGIAEIPGAGFMRLAIWPLLFVNYLVWQWYRGSATRQHARESRRRYAQSHD